MGSDAPLSDICSDDKIEYESVVMPIPQYDVDNPQMISQGPSVCIFNKEDSGEVMASWLFVQYLLSNDVQIAYASTEGYVPVTSKAQESEEYLEYLSKSGIDNNEHYKIKIEATKILLENVNHTFVTPVFNGSASLRMAAGQLIESTAKSVRRKQTVDDEYIEKLYDDTISLYRLDQIATSDDSDSIKKDLGPLPTASVILLATLSIVWMLMIAYIIRQKILQNVKK